MVQANIRTTSENNSTGLILSSWACPMRNIVMIVKLAPIRLSKSM